RDTSGTTGTIDVLLLKYRTKGALAWSTTFGSVKDDRAWAVSLSGRRLFVGGETEGDLPGQTSAGMSDAFLSEYQPNGTQDWLKQIGTTENAVGQGVGASNGRAFLVGYTHGAFPGLVNHGGYDAFVVKVV